MRIVLEDNGKSYEVKLLPRDVKMAKQLINDFLNSVKRNAEERGAPTLLPTTLILMHVMSQDNLKALNAGDKQRSVSFLYL